MANTLHYYQLRHAGREYVSYPPASEKLDDVAQKGTNHASPSIRTMKRRCPIGAAHDPALTNEAGAPPRVMLASLESEDTAYRLFPLTVHSHCGALRPSFKIASKMGKDPNKPRGKMSSYAYFVQTCREEHKKKHPEASVNFAEFSKKCSERWKTMSAKEKGKFEDLAKQDKVRYEREMMDYIPVGKGGKKKPFKDPNAPKRPPSAFFIFCAEFRPKVKGETPGLTIGDVAKRLGEMWNGTSAEDKQPYEKKASKLKEKYVKDVAAYRAKGKTGSSAPAKAPPVKVDKKDDDDDDDDDDDEEDEDDDDDDDE